MTEIAPETSKIGPVEMKISNFFGQLQKSLLFLTEYAQDFSMYVRYCGISPFQESRKKNFYKIIIEAHAIEKGLSLANPRQLFGQDKIKHLMRMVRRYGIASNEIPVTMAIGALQTYLDRHLELGASAPLLNQIDIFLTERKSCSSQPGNGGIRLFPGGGSTTGPDSENLLLSRFSCRIYDSAPLSQEEIGHIVRLAQTAPSQCNRQATCIHYFDNKDQITSLLRLQGGSAGFIQDVPGLFIVAFDLAAWGGAQQRNQGYVDASLFAMSLMLSAQARGAVTCPLNLAVRHGIERKIRSVGHIPPDQRLVMMIAIGKNSSGTLKAAASPRRPLGDILNMGGAPLRPDTPPS